ncbi:MAG: Kelch repeat-containing protein [Bacteroidales bacterium]
MTRTRTIGITGLACMIMLPFFSQHLQAQDENPGQPLNRLYHDLVTHDSTNKIYLIGGQAGHGMDDYLIYTKVWAYDLTSRKWNYVCENRATITGITTRSAVQSAVWDRQSNRIILINLARKTWAFHPETKGREQMSPENIPPKRVGQNMVYDAESDRVIMFGGFPGTLSSNFYDDTWAYDYNSDTWEEMNPENPPPKRGYANMVYNSRSDRVMLWGGRDYTGELTDISMWEYDYNTNTWSNFIPVGGPEYPHAYSQMLYDSVKNELYLFGGGHVTNITAGILYDDNWIYHCEDSTWSEIAVEGGPVRVSLHAMAFMPGQEQILLIGGETGSTIYTNNMLDGTWIMDYTEKTWHEELFAFAGNDASLCSYDVDGARLLGGEESAWGGLEPYQYNWSAEGLLSGAPVDASALLDDVTSANPAIVGAADSVSFFLEVTDSLGTVAYDTVRYLVSSLSACEDVWEEDFYKGDSVQLDHCVEGGMGPVTYLWEPAEFLSDTAASRPWASTDSVSKTFELVVTDTLGCVVTSTFSVNYSTVGLEQRADEETKVTVRSLADGSGTRLLIENKLPEILRMEILGISGRLMEQVNLPRGSSERYLSDYRPGLYLYRISSVDELIGTGKFVIN